MLTKHDGAAIGAQRRDAGIATAESGHVEEILEAELRFLEKLIDYDQATTDDIPEDRATKYVKGGKWVGSIPLRLARRGLIQRVEMVRSSRPSRHGGYVVLWKVRDLDGVVSRILAIDRLLNAIDNAKAKAGPATAIAEPTENQAGNPTRNGEKTDGSTE